MLVYGEKKKFQLCLRSVYLFFKKKISKNNNNSNISKPIVF